MNYKIKIFLVSSFTFLFHCSNGQATDLRVTSFADIKLDRSHEKPTRETLYLCHIGSIPENGILEPGETEPCLYFSASPFPSTKHMKHLDARTTVIMIPYSEVSDRVIGFSPYEVLVAGPIDLATQKGVEILVSKGEKLPKVLGDKKVHEYTSQKDEKANSSARNKAALGILIKSRAMIFNLGLDGDESWGKQTTVTTERGSQNINTEESFRYIMPEGVFYGVPSNCFNQEGYPIGVGIIAHCKNEYYKVEGMLEKGENAAEKELERVKKEFDDYYLPEFSKYIGGIKGLHQTYRDEVIALFKTRMENGLAYLTEEFKKGCTKRLMNRTYGFMEKFLSYLKGRCVRPSMKKT